MRWYVAITALVTMYYTECLVWHGVNVGQTHYHHPPFLPPKPKFTDSKTAKDCQMYWDNFMSPAVNNGPWSKEEDKKLMKLAQQYDGKDWPTIAKELNVSALHNHALILAITISRSI